MTAKEPIYSPKGKALEYAPKALNYYDGCHGGCDYPCYMEKLRPGFSHRNPVGVNKGFTFRALGEQLKTFKVQPGEYVLLCFAGDPYDIADDQFEITRTVLEMFLEHKVPVRILTKQGTRCLRDIMLFREFAEAGIDIKVGQSLTFDNPSDSLRHEPGCAVPDDRLLALHVLDRWGIPTWASFEPVIDPAQSLAMMVRGLEFIDYYAIGKLNHKPEFEKTTDWGLFGKKAEELMNNCGKKYLIKEDLRREMEAKR